MQQRAPSRHRHGRFPTARTFGRAARPDPLPSVREVAPRSLFACSVFRLAGDDTREIGSLIGAVFGLIFVLTECRGWKRLTLGT